MAVTMTKKKFFAVCSCINVLFIGAQIYKHTQFVRYTYRKQQEERTLQQQQETIAALTQQLYALQDRTAIKEFAQKELGMKPVALHQIQRLPT
jgi:cell division protein FtsB